MINILAFNNVFIIQWFIILKGV